MKVEDAKARFFRQICAHRSDGERSSDDRQIVTLHWSAFKGGKTWLAERAPVEKATGIAAYVSFGDPGPAIEAFAGKVGRAPNDAPVSQDTLFQMGSTSKSFAAAVILKLEAAGKLSLDDTVGRWLPEYPAWKDVSVRRLLNMSSGIPNYSETEAMSRTWAEEPNRTLSARDLVKLAYPSATNNLRIHHRLSLLQHQLHPGRHDRRQGGRQALSRSRARASA